MKAKIELDAGDIRRIVSQHFGVEEDEITVSPRARVLIPGEAEPVTPQQAPAKAAPEPVQATQTAKEPEKQATAPEPKSRVERLFGPREEWSTAPPAEDQPEAEGGTVRPVKGFLIIRCRSCGKSKSFFLREYATATRCAGCGEEIPLDGNLLRPAYMKCPACENALRYQTNFTGEQIEINCKKCGAPVDLELNGKGTAYYTVGMEANK